MLACLSVLGKDLGPGVHVHVTHPYASSAFCHCCSTPGLLRLVSGVVGRSGDYMLSSGVFLHFLLGMLFYCVFFSETPRALWVKFQPLIAAWG